MHQQKVCCQNPFGPNIPGTIEPEGKVLIRFVTKVCPPANFMNYNEQLTLITYLFQNCSVLHFVESFGIPKDLKEETHFMIILLFAMKLYIEDIWHGHKKKNWP